VIISLTFFTLLTIYFLDFAGLLPDALHQLTRLQLIPAILAINIGALVFILLITVFFGRVYCSSICPMGIFQDVMNWMSNRFNRKKKYTYLRQQVWIRWSLVAITIIGLVSSASFIVSILDPYSAYGRMATTLVKPVYMAGNNLLAWIGSWFGSYRFYKVEIFFTSMSALAIALLTLAVVGYLS